MSVRTTVVTAPAAKAEGTIQGKPAAQDVTFILEGNNHTFFLNSGVSDTVFIKANHDQLHISGGSDNRVVDKGQGNTITIAGAHNTQLLDFQHDHTGLIDLAAKSYTMGSDGHGGTNVYFQGQTLDVVGDRHLSAHQIHLV